MAFPGELNLTYYKGDTQDFSIYPKQSDGSAFIMSGYTIKFSISTQRGSGTTPVECYAVVSADDPTKAALAEGIVPGGGVSLIKAFSALRGTRAMPMFVKVVGGAGGITDMLKSKPSTAAPKLDPKTGRYRDPSTGKFTKSPGSTGGAGGKVGVPKGGGGGIFGKVGDFFSDVGSSIKKSSVGKLVSSTVGKAQNLASKAIDFANPMTYVKKYMPKLMSSKGFKGIVSNIPKIGKLASLAMIAYDLFSQGKSVSDAAKAGAAPQDIGKQVVMALGDLGGSVIGGALGTLIPIPGVYCLNPKS